MHTEPLDEEERVIFGDLTGALRAVVAGSPPELADVHRCRAYC
jgi:hypothetical protein